MTVSVFPFHLLFPFSWKTVLTAPADPVYSVPGQSLAFQSLVVFVSLAEMRFTMLKTELSFFHGGLPELRYFCVGWVVSCRQNSYQMFAFVQQEENTEGVLSDNKELNLVYPVQNKQNLKPEKLFWKGTELPAGCQPSEA